MIRDGRRADPITLKSHFERDETLQEIGGMEYLARLARSSAAPVSVPTYARLVRDLALRREALRLAEEMLAEIPVLADDQSASEYISEMSARLIQLGEGGTAQNTTFDARALVGAALEEAAAAYQNGGRRPGCISSGIEPLDDLIGGFARGTVTTVGGRPGMGKSALSLVVAYNAASQGMPTLYGSMEMTRAQNGHRFLSMATHIPYVRVDAGGSPSRNMPFSVTPRNG